MPAYPPEVAQSGRSASGPGSERNPASASQPLHSAFGAVLFLLVLALAVAAQLLLLRYVDAAPIALATAVHPNRFAGSAVLAIAVAVSTVALALRERHSLASYGLAPSHAVRNLIGGALAGVALVSAVVLLLHQLDLVIFRGQVLFGATAQWKLALRSAAFCATVAFAEEGLVRGYLQHALTRTFAPLLQRSPAASAASAAGGSGVPAAFWIAAALLSVLFALLQQMYTGTGQLVLANATLFGLLMAFSLWRTGSLWWALGYHAAWDWAQSFLWGVPNGGIRATDHLFYTEAIGPALRSGGGFGPEGSAYTAGALIAGFAILMLLRRSRVYPELWPETAAQKFERTSPFRMKR